MGIVSNHWKHSFLIDWSVALEIYRSEEAYLLARKGLDFIGKLLLGEQEMLFTCVSLECFKWF